MIGMGGKLLKKTKSLCPECLKVIEAEVVEEDGKALMRKECPEHGKFQDIYWSDAELYKRFQKFAEIGDGIKNPRTKESKGCPYDCGICFTGDMDIFTDEGPRTLEQLYQSGISLKIDENIDAKSIPNLRVLTHENTFSKIKYVTRHWHDGKILRITPMYLNEDILVTPYHEFFAVKRKGRRFRILKKTSLKVEKVKAEELSKGDYLLIPKISETVDIDQIILKEVIQKAQISSREIKEVQDATKFKLGKKKAPRQIPVNKSFCRLIGYYLAEGYAYRDKSRPNSFKMLISFREDENEFINDCLQIIRKIFHEKARLVHSKRYHTTTIHVSNSLIACFFLSLFGSKSINKRLPPSFLFLARPKQMEIIRGLFRGDGYFQKEKGTIYHASLSTSSKELAFQTAHLLLRNNFVPSIHKVHPEKNRKAKNVEFKLLVSGREFPRFVANVWDIHLRDNVKRRKHAIINDEQILVPIKRKQGTQFTGYVYTLSVNPIHSYTIQNVAVGNCPNHKSHTVLSIIDVTNRCNLRCPICFANAAAAGYVYEPTFEQIKEMLKNLRANRPTPPPAIQLSGGEPTLRDDLPEIVRAAKEAGFWHVEVNTNGIRLAKDLDFIKRLREAGVSTIYLQFDGMTPEPTIEARGADILQLKFKAIENCRKAGLTSIVLVVTLVKGVNDGQLGDIIRFAAENKDIVRCVNVQPVSFAGRISQEERERWRITIPDFMKAVEQQTGGQIKVSDFYPVPSTVPISRFTSAYTGKEFVKFTCHEHCGTATYVFVEDGRFIPITRFVDIPKLFGLLDKYAEQLKKGGFAIKARVLAKAAKEVPGTIDMSKAPKDLNLTKIILKVLATGSYKALAEFHERAILLAAMHFQDGYNFDLDRMERCGIHYAVPDGRIIPFCSYNSIHRHDVERKFSNSLAK